MPFIVLRYGSISVDPPLVLAPMAGVTDRQFRLILRRVGGAGLVAMEFVSSEALTRGNRRAFRPFIVFNLPLHPCIRPSDPDLLPV